MSVDRSNFARADAAVIDVGSNSVRLVVYSLAGRAIWPVFNEKILAGLGRDLALTRRLSPKGIEAALTALARFRILLDASRLAQVQAVATAAVRDAHDGSAFCRRVRQETGFRLRVLSGDEEARYSALGVVAGAPRADGLAADLGGASLELAVLGREHAPGASLTLPLGPFSFAAPFDARQVRTAVADSLRDRRAVFRAATLHAVGGAWRSLALVHMKMSNYPVNIIHQYSMSRNDALQLARFVEQQSRASLERIDGLSRRRVEALPHAAAVLEALVTGLDLERVVLSAYGLREGLIFASMDEQTRSREPLVAGCAALGGFPEAAERFGSALEAWLSPAFARLAPIFGERDRTLLAAACRLADLGVLLHPDQRADLIFQQVLRAPVADLGHAERVFLACAAFGRYTSSSAKPAPNIVDRLLSPLQYRRARAIGAAVRLGCDLTGRRPEVLEMARLQIKNSHVAIHAEAGWESVLLSEKVQRRASTLAEFIDRPLKIRRTPQLPRTEEIQPTRPV